MKPFAKLSARQWEVIVDLVWQKATNDGYDRAEPNMSRSDVIPKLTADVLDELSEAFRADILRDRITESQRVATIRSYASLERRGLIARVESHTPIFSARTCRGTRTWRRGLRPRWELAVSPRAVLNAAVDGDVKSVNIGLLRWWVERAERIEWRWERYARMEERRRQRERPRWGGDPFQHALCCVHGGLKMAAEEGSPDPAGRIHDVFAGIFDRPLIDLAIAKLKESGAWDRTIAEEATRAAHKGP